MTGYKSFSSNPLNSHFVNLTVLNALAIGRENQGDVVAGDWLPLFVQDGIGPPLLLGIPDGIVVYGLSTYRRRASVPVRNPSPLTR